METKYSIVSTIFLLNSQKHPQEQFYIHAELLFIANSIGEQINCIQQSKKILEINCKITITVGNYMKIQRN